MGGLILHCFACLRSLGCTGNTRASLMNEAREQLYASRLPIAPSKCVSSTTVGSHSHATFLLFSSLIDATFQFCVEYL